MRRLFSLSFALVIPLSALAQAEEASEPGDEDSVTFEPAAEEAVPYGGDSPSEGGLTPATAPESYAVQPGDTLWGLSQRFLNNPWYWPKIWSYNPNLDNPNWLRPGSVLRFYPGEQVVDAPDEETPIDDIGEGGGFEVGAGLDNRIVTGSNVRRREFFVSSERVEDAGELNNSPEEKQLLVPADRVYLTLKKSARPGEVLQVFRNERELVHPVTGVAAGNIVTLVGEVRIDQAGQEQLLGTVVSAWEPLERGLHVATLPVLTDPVNRVENSKNVKGYVIDAAPSPLSFLGESFVVVIDKGSAEGITAGNTFVVVRGGDPYTREYSGMADEEIGELIVIETFRGVSTALVTAASRVIVPGDRIDMRAR